MQSSKKKVHDVDVNAWKDLYRAFGTIIRLSPWSWLGKHDFFGVQTDDGKEPVFVHIAETDTAEHPGLSLTFGWRADALYHYVLSGQVHAAMRSYEIPLVRCYMRPVSAMTTVEREIFDAADAKPDMQGRGAVFVRYKPGWTPWILHEDDVVHATKILNQAIGILLRAETDKSIVIRDNPSSVWIRKCGSSSEEIVEDWCDVPEFSDFAPSKKSMPSEQLIEKINALPDDIETVEVDMDVVPNMAFINDEVIARVHGGGIPLAYFFAVCSASCKKDETPCIGNNVFYPCDNIENMWNTVPEALLNIFAKFGRRPREICVNSKQMADFIRPLQMKIHFKLTFHSELPHFDAVLARTRELVEVAIKSKQGINETPNQ